MSWEENESGPFVVFFLPAVVGCLAILLARRWSTSQVSNTSTAFSRRRKINKDPLLKRPLPFITTKMVAPGAKKSFGTAKKVSQGPQGAPQVSDEDINGKRTRPHLSPLTASVPDSKLADNPLPPKHIPFPNIPQDGEVLFEIMSFVFTIVATGLQFLNLYRTMWWLPYSFTSDAMNFYLIDAHLATFIIIVLCRRLLLSLSLACVRSCCDFSPNVMLYITVVVRMSVLSVVLGAMAWCAYFIMVKHSPLKIVYLCYPSLIYFILFGMTAGPFLELHKTSALMMHSCSHEPEHIRREVEVLRHDFNSRVKKILFNSVLGAYYSSFLPCCFAQSYLHYDAAAAAQQTGLVWGALCCRYVAQLLPAAHADAPHRAAKHLGRWTPLAALPPHTSEVGEWSDSKWWRCGDRVRVAGSVYEASAPLVCAHPTNVHHIRFYSVFNNPSKLLCLLLCLQLALVGMQVCLLFSSFAWHNFLAVLILLFINYYTLYKMLRDYLVAWRVYKAETLIQEKNDATQTTN